MAPRAKTVLFFFAFAVVFASGQYVLDDSVGLGRKFDGIGGLSAGAVRISTSLDGFCNWAFAFPMRLIKFSVLTIYLL